MCKRFSLFLFAYVKGAPRLLSDIRKSFAYNLNFENILSHFQITCNEKDKTKTNSNQLNLATKVIKSACNSKSMATESNELFHLLQNIVQMFGQIGIAVNDKDKIYDENMIGDAIRLVETLNKFYRIESELYMEL